MLPDGAWFAEVFEAAALRVAIARAWRSLVELSSAPEGCEGSGRVRRRGATWRRG